MNILVAKDYAEISRIASLIIAKEIRRKPNAVLGLATGGTPLGTYGELIKMWRAGELSFAEVVSFNLDEYYGLPADHKQSYAYSMQENFFKHIDIKPHNIHIPNGVPGDIAEECRRYDELIEKHGGIDLQLLGIGSNGHIGFNEPDRELKVNTHLVKLKDQTIRDNSRFFNSWAEVPKTAITMGLGPIMKAKKILLLASGESKAEIIAKIVNGTYSTKIPASTLQIHPDATIVIDREIALHPVNKSLLQEGNLRVRRWPPG